MSKILYPTWKYTHKGFPPPDPTPCRGRWQRGRGGSMGWDWVGGNPFGYISILDTEYWISVLYRKLEHPLIHQTTQYSSSRCEI